jgi:hypothetical protein
MKRSRETPLLGKDHSVTASLGNPMECRITLSSAIAKRAYEIYERQGRRPGNDRANWRLAESEVLQPLCCGRLESKDKVIVSLLCSAVDGNDIRRIEVVVEPHRLILVGERQPDSESGKQPSVYRMLPLKEEFDPSSVKLRQRGSLLEIEIDKALANKKAITAQKAA